MQLIYISGPITFKTGKVSPKHVTDAICMAKYVWGKGHCVFLPHYAAEELNNATDWDTFITGDKLIIERCDAIWVHPEWEKSPGCVAEVEHAIEHSIPVLHSQEELDEFLADPPTRLLNVRSFDLLDDTVKDYMQKTVLPKFQKGSLEHGVGTWKKLGFDWLMRVNIPEEHMDLAFYHLFLSLLLTHPEKYGKISSVNKNKGETNES